MNHEEVIITSSSELDSLVQQNKGVIVYFSTPDCNVCKVLKPKIKEMLAGEFPELTFASVDISKSPETAAQNSIFTVPTMIIYFEGKEFQRKSRNISIDELEEYISRPYSMLF